MDVEGEGMISDIKKSYNKNVKNNKLGKAIRETAEKGLGQVYDTGVIQIGNTRHLGGVADALKKVKGIISKLTQLSGLGLKLQGDGVMKDARYRRPIAMGNGMRMSVGACQSCNGSGMNDKFIFENVSL
jgi:hypothetical protein